MVRELAVSARNRTSRTWRGNGEILRNAHVHHECFAKNRYESCGLAVGPRFATRKGIKKIDLVKKVKVYECSNLYELKVLHHCNHLTKPIKLYRF